MNGVRNSKLIQLQEPFKLIAEWHANITMSQMTYKFSPEGLEVYRAFADEMADAINDDWAACKFQRSSKSKDKRTMIRYVYF